MATAGNSVFDKIGRCLAGEDDVSTGRDNINKERSHTAGGGLSRGKKRQLTVNCDYDDVTQRPTL